MLQAAAAFGDQVEKDVARIGGHSPELLVMLNDLRHIARSRFAVPQAVFVEVGQNVLFAADLKLVDLCFHAQ